MILISHVVYIEIRSWCMWRCLSSSRSKKGINTRYDRSISELFYYTVSYSNRIYSSVSTKYLND